MHGAAGTLQQRHAWAGFHVPSRCLVTATGQRPLTVHLPGYWLVVKHKREDTALPQPQGDNARLLSNLPDGRQDACVWRKDGGGGEVRVRLGWAGRVLSNDCPASGNSTSDGCPPQGVVMRLVEQFLAYLVALT
jgi:hypothetical protein